MSQQGGQEGEKTQAKTPRARDEGPLKEARGAQVSSEPPEPPIAFALLGAVALVQGDLALGELPVAAVTVRDDVQEMVVPVGIGGWWTSTKILDIWLGLVSQHHVFQNFPNSSNCIFGSAPISSSLPMMEGNCKEN